MSTPVVPPAVNEHGETIVYIKKDETPEEIFKNLDKILESHVGMDRILLVVDGENLVHINNEDAEIHDHAMMNMVKECIFVKFFGIDKRVCVRVMGEKKNSKEEYANALKKLIHIKEDKEKDIKEKKPVFLIPIDADPELYVVKAGERRAIYWIDIIPGDDKHPDYVHDLFMHGICSNFTDYTKKCDFIAFTKDSKWEEAVRRATGGKPFYSKCGEFNCHATKILGAEEFVEHGDIDFEGKGGVRPRYIKMIAELKEKYANEKNEAKKAVQKALWERIESALELDNTSMRKAICTMARESYFACDESGVSVLTPAQLKVEGNLTIVDMDIFKGKPGRFMGLNGLSNCDHSEPLMGFDAFMLDNLPGNVALHAATVYYRAQHCEHFMQYLRLCAKYNIVPSEAAIHNLCKFEDDAWGGGMGCPAYYVRTHEMSNNKTFTNVLGYGMILAILLMPDLPFCENSIYTEELRAKARSVMGADKGAKNIYINCLNRVYYIIKTAFKVPEDMKVKPDPVGEVEELHPDYDIVVKDPQYSEFMLADDDLPEEIEAWLSGFPTDFQEKLRLRKRNRAAEAESSNKRSNSANEPASPPPPLATRCNSD